MDGRWVVSDGVFATEKNSRQVFTIVHSLKDGPSIEKTINDTENVFHLCRRAPVNHDFISPKFQRDRPLH